MELVSTDSGRTWNEGRGQRVEGREGTAGNAPDSLYPLPATLYPVPKGTNAVSFADSIWWAVGEPGLICRWDGTKWREVHRAPFAVDPPTTPQPPPTPLRFAGGGVRDEVGAHIAFSSAAHGAITVGNRIYVTDDSAVTWRECILPDTSSITALFLLNDSISVIGTRDGELFYDSADVILRKDSILQRSNQSGWGAQTPGWETSPLQYSSPYEGEGPGRGIIQIGWKDKLDGNLFVLTDSVLYSVPTDLSSATVYSLPLNPGERAGFASFPDTYTGFVLTDSTRRIDTLASDGRDTTLVFDTSKIYRSLDGGATWCLVLKNIPGLTHLYFENTKTGFAYGAGGTIYHSEDSGSHWARAWTATNQPLHDLRMVNDRIGYAVGDSGVVLMTQASGRFWRPAPPEPLFSHPGTSYTGIAFPEDQTVYIVSNDRCYKSHVPEPVYFHPHWHWPVRHTLTISERPNPSSGQVELDIQQAGNNNTGDSDITDAPSLHICDLSGNVITQISSMQELSPGAWRATADLSDLAPSPYVAVVQLGDQQATCKFLIER